nr:MAG TPA: hypothetical protein [Caudoviricetes sp.]
MLLIHKQLYSFICNLFYIGLYPLLNIYAYVFIIYSICYL